MPFEIALLVLLSPLCSLGVATSEAVLGTCDLGGTTFDADAAVAPSSPW